MIHEFEFLTEFRQSPEELFPFFADAANLERITPASLRFRIITPRPIAMREGSLIEYRLRLHGFPFRWRTRIARWDPPRHFRDIQERGPWARWEHDHLLEPGPAGGTRMHDRLRVQAPFGWLGELLWPWLEKEVRGIFAHRTHILREIFGPPDRGHS